MQQSGNDALNALQSLFAGKFILKWRNFDVCCQTHA